MSHQHHSHGHAHGDHGGHDHNDEHGHDHSDDVEPALQSMLYKQIEFDKIRILNESEVDAGRKIIEKPWANRLDPTPELVSDADEQLLIFIPFAGAVKLHSVLIRAEDSPACPQTLKLFHNRDELDFSTATDAAPTQTLQLARSNEIQELPVKRALFGSVHSLSMFIEDNHGDDASRLSWLAFKGDFRELKREPVEVLYEKAANPKDHELIAGIGEKGASRQGM